MTEFEFYEVGGVVRDGLLGIKTKDIDFSAVWNGPDLINLDYAFVRLGEFLAEEGYRIWEYRPEHLTIRAQFPAGHPAFSLHPDSKKLDADFVLARKDGPYSDGRRPDWTKPGTLLDDLARRDFTVNAMARMTNGTLIDPHGGQDDLASRTLRCVGSAKDRLTEDHLRALRAVRFMVTKGFKPDEELWAALTSSWLPPLVATLPADRKRQELERTFQHDTLATLDILCHMIPVELLEAIFRDGLRLKPTSEA